MEKEQVLKIRELAADWRAMQSDIAKGENFERGVFERIFEETYTLIAPCSIKTEIQKEFMPLIVAMHQFMYSHVAGKDKEYTAAVVITERLLYHCIIIPTPYIEPVECAPIYSLEKCEDFNIDFTNVGFSITELSEAL